MKKCGFLLLVAALVTISATGISAADAQVSLTSCTAYSGDDIIVKVNIDENPGFIASVINISYDSEVFTLKSVKDMKLLGENNHSDNLSSELYSLSWFNPLSEEDYDEEGTVAELTFNINENAAGGLHTIGIAVKEMWNTNIEEVSVSEGVAADINVIKYLCESDNESDGESEDKTTTIIGVEGTLSGKVKIPDTLEGKNVIGIAAETFEGCGEITEITVPDSVKTIGDRAFANCTKLEKVSLPESLEAVGDDIITGTALYENSDNWEEEVLYIDKYLVSLNKQDITEFTVKAGSTLIADNAFSDCAKLEVLTLPKSIKYIGENAFNGCDALSEVTYEGSERTWGRVTVASGNEALLSAEIIFTMTSIPGDVTGDGEVDVIDLLRLGKYLADWDVEIDEAASDVTGDGKVDVIDLLRLGKYLADWDVELG